MNDSLMAIIAIVLGAVLMFIFPLMSTADNKDDISQQAIQTAVTEFVDNVRATGKITADKLQALSEAAIQVGITPDIVVEAQILDESSKKKTAEAQSTKVGENNYFSVYTTQIMDEINEYGEYNLKEGDIIFVSLKNTNLTIADILKNFAYKVTGNGGAGSITAQHSGIVNVNSFRK